MSILKVERVSEMDSDMNNEQENKKGIRKVNLAELQSLNLRTNRKPKKSSSLYDSNIIDRNYWGNDPGTDIEMSLTRIEIRRSLKEGQMLDIKNYQKAAHLSYKSIMELMEYQFHFMTILADENSANIFENINNDGFVMVDIDENTNAYNFVFVK
jgi:hypothetical protein